MGKYGRKSDKIYNWLRSYIDENKFSINNKLPSETILCNKFSVSRETVRFAQERLQKESLIYKVRGSGTYINKATALSAKPETSTASVKIGLILQGQDANANSGLIRGIKCILKEKEAELQIFFTDNKFASERACLKTVIHQGFDGFIVDGVKASLINPNLDCYRSIFEKRIPVIFYNNYYKELKYPKVITHDWKCARELVYRLIRAGHRHIAGIFVHDNYQSIEKFRGYVNTMNKYGVDFDDNYVKWCASNEAHVSIFSKEISRFLKGLQKCTAIVCCNYMILQIVLNALSKMDKKVPQDYSLVCFDYSNDDWSKIGITCSIHPGFEMGQQVGNRLIKMISNNDFLDNGYSYTFAPNIYEGQSILQLHR